MGQIQKRYLLIALSLDSAYLSESSQGKEKFYRIQSLELRGCVDRVNFEHGKICGKLHVPLDSSIALNLKKTLEENLGYRPKEVPSLSDADRRIGLAQVGYTHQNKDFSTLESALSMLYGFWRRISSDPDLIKRMLTLERKAKEKAELGIDALVMDLFR